MILRTTITKIEARRNSDDPVTSININITFDDVLIKDGDLKIDYTYSVDYTPGVGSMVLTGSLYAKEDAALCAEVEKSWSANRKLPKDYAEEVLNSINIVCGTNGTFISRPLNLAPPMMPPRIELTEEGENKT